MRSQAFLVPLFGLLCALVGVLVWGVMANGSIPTAARSEADGSDSPGDLASKEGKVAIFAGGCFWCMEPPYDKIEGVLSTTAGYTGGHVANPTYRQVSSGGTGHAEAVRITYNPDKVSYARLLVVFWHNIDPVAVDRQFCDEGSQYRSAIFYKGPHQGQLAKRSRELLKASNRFDQPIATEIEPAGPFYRAEADHQNYYKEHATRYRFYRWSCGRDDRLQEIWGNLAGASEAGKALRPLLEEKQTGR